MSFAFSSRRDPAAMSRVWEETLADHGHPPGHVWVFREDVAWNWPRHMLQVVIDDRDANLRLATRLLDCHDARSLGVELTLLGSTTRTSYCTIFVPHTEREAEELMIGGVKHSIPTRLYAICTERLVGDIRRGTFPFSDRIHWRADVRCE